MYWDLAIKAPDQCDAGNAIPELLWDSSLGRETLNLEAVALAPFTRRLHGDAALWTGTSTSPADALQGCMVRNAIFLQQQRDGAHQNMPSLSARLEALPFKSNSLDGVVLHHALELTSDPRVALREVTRVLTPGGRVIICGFNPLSLLGARRLYAKYFADSLSGHRFINPIRLFDWLTLLGFELDEKPLYCGYGLPMRRLVKKLDLPLLGRREQIGHAEQIGASHIMIPFGSVLIVSATKQAVSMRPQWRTRKEERHQLAPVAYPSRLLQKPQKPADVSSWRRIKP
jgi:SAM-dependent methyltransferase